jgi:hypothetical protein
MCVSYYLQFYYALMRDWRIKYMRNRSTFKLFSGWTFLHLVALLTTQAICKFLKIILAWHYEPSRLISPDSEHCHVV